MEKKKVLILYAPLGEGHGSAARAIAEAFALKYPDIEVKNVDVLDFVFEIFKHGLPWVYNQTTAQVPTLYRLIYKYFNLSSHHKHLDNVSSIILKKSRFVQFIEDFNPDFIVFTNPLSTQLLSLTKKKNIITIPSASVCTDFGFHTLWNNDDVNYYFVANEEVKKSLIKQKFKPDTIKVTGIPISNRFNEVPDRQNIINNLNFDDKKPIILIVGGRIRYKDLIKIIKGVKKKNNEVQFIVVAGRDKILQEKLKDSDIKQDLYVRVFNFINNMDEYMEVANLILTKAGGLTVSECLAKNLPMIFNDVIPGQEEDNVKYTAKRGASIKAGSARRSIDAINKLIFNKGLLAKKEEIACIKFTF